MADNGKEIVFTFKVDQQSLKQVTDAVKNVTDQFKAMNAAMSGGTGSGNVGGVGGTGSPILRGTGNTGTSGGSGANKTITQSFLETIKVVKDLGKVSKDSLSILKQVSKDAAAEQTRALENQIAAVKKLKDEYNALQRQIRGGGAAGAAAAQALPGVSQQMAGAVGQQIQTQANLRDINKWQSGQSFLGGVGNFLGVDKFAPNSLLGYMRMGGMALYGANLIGKEAIDSQTRLDKSITERQKVFAGARSATKSGDLSYLYAMKQMATGQEGRDIMNRSTSPGMAAAYYAANLSISPTDLGYNFLDASQTTAFAQMDMSNVDAKRKENLLQTEAFGRLSQEYRPRMAQMRQLGFRKYLDKRTGTTKTFKEFLYEQTGQGGFSEDEFLSAQGAIAGTSSRGIANALGGLGMRATAGGLNINALLGSMAIAGGGKGSAAIASGAFGATGNNMAIQNILSTVNQGLYSGGFMTGGQGALGALTAFGFGGGDASDMLRAAFAQKGMDATTSFYQGKTDNYQQARNTLSAIKALGPGASSYAVDFMANKMSAGEISDIIATGKVPMQLQRMLGMDEKQALGAVSTYQKDVSVSAMERLVDPRSALYGTSRGISEAGGIKQYLAQQTKGLKGSALRAKQREIIEDYGGILSMSDKSLDIQTATSRAYIEAGMGRLQKRRGGPGDAARGSAEEAIAMGVEKTNMQEFETTVKTLEKDIKGLATGISTLSKDFVGKMTNLGGTSEDTAISILALGEAAAAATSGLGGDFQKLRDKAIATIASKAQKDKAVEPIKPSASPLFNKGS